MCLHIDAKDEAKTKKFKTRKKPIIAYKILDQYDGELTSPYQYTQWFPNKIKVSNRRLKDPTQLTRNEKSLTTAKKGLHFFQTKKEAIQAKRFFHCWRTEVWTVEIQPKDIISTGTSSGYPNIVAHKAKLIKKIF